MRNNIRQPANPTAEQEPFKRAHTFKTTSDKKTQTVTEACFPQSHGPGVLVYSLLLGERNYTHKHTYV